MISLHRHTGALCAMKEVNIIPDDPKSAECLKQLEQVSVASLSYFVVGIEFFFPLFSPLTFHVS